MSNAVVADVPPAETETTDAKQSDSDRLSNQHESEYDTASDSPSDDEDDLHSGEYDDELRSSEEDDLDEEEHGSGLHSDEEAGEEAEGEDGEKKKVDDDEDRSNPQYIPKKGTFYEHDDRTADSSMVVGKATSVTEEPVGPAIKADSAENVSSTVSPLPTKAPPKKTSGGDKWSHDRFDMSEQAPKSRSELVSAYGYDIRSEDGPPKVKRNKHYGRGPTKYDRNWEDENAYGKQVVAKRTPRGPPKGEDFPKLNERRPKKSSHNREDRESNHDGDAGSEDRGYHPRERRHPNSGPRGEGRSFRGSGSEKGREFKGRNTSGRGGRESGRGSRRKTGDDEVRASGGHGRNDPDQQSFNGMSFTNSNLSHGKRNQDNQDQHRNNGPTEEPQSQRSIPTANNSRTVNYGSGRLQRRDDTKTAPPQHFHDHSQQSPAAEMVGQLPLHAPNTTQPQLAKRYSEKRGIRNEQQSQQQAQQQQQNNVGVMESQTQPQLLQHPVAQQQTQQQPPSHHGQSTGPPPPFASQRGYSQIEPQQMLAQPQSLPVVAPSTTVVPQAQAPLPAQYANYYPNEYLPQSTPQPQAPPSAYPSQAPVAAANGPPPQAPLINYVPAMPNQPNQAPYSQYPGYQNYPQMPIPAGPPANNVTYFAPPAATPPQVQPPPRAVLPKRRPTNAIPIVSPPDRNVPMAGKGRGRLVNDSPAPGVAGLDEKSGGGDDIDHILDNMFVPRPQQAMTASSGSRNKGGDDASKETGLDEGMKDLRMTDGAARDGGLSAKPGNSE